VIDPVDHAGQPDIRTLAMALLRACAVPKREVEDYGRFGRALQTAALRRPRADGGGPEYRRELRTFAFSVERPRSPRSLAVVDSRELFTDADHSAGLRQGPAVVRDGERDLEDRLAILLSRHVE
jgi:hypothetical protein